jgi:hypothetical protein
LTRLGSAKKKERKKLCSSGTLLASLPKMKSVETERHGEGWEVERSLRLTAQLPTNRHEQLSSVDWIQGVTRPTDGIKGARFFKKWRDEG